MTTEGTIRGVIRRRAGEIGREYRAAYSEEFGAQIDPSACGDWDATAWGEAIRQLQSEEGLDIRDSEETRQALDAFREGLFGQI